MMKQKLFFVFMVLGFSIILGGCVTTAEEETSGIPDSYNLEDYQEVLFDDFDGTDLDKSIWDRCPEWQRQDHGGYWKNDCSYVKDGCLVLEGRRGAEHLESGAIRSRGKFMQAGGAYQIRFKAEKKSGIWSAFWLMYAGASDTDGKASKDGEIDIFEIISNDNGRKYLNSAVHWDGYSANHKSKGAQYYISDSFYDQWHTVTFYWGNEYYVAYLDDAEKPYWKGKVSEYGGPALTPHYIKITSEFGKWGGPVVDTALPSYFLVDWVKVYTRK